MGEAAGYKSNIIIRELIRKSLFTERQIEIILSQGQTNPRISRGAYYRQRAQTRKKVKALFYSVVLMCGLGVLPDASLGVMRQIAEQVNVISDSDVTFGSEQVLDVLEKTIEMALNM